MRRWICIAYLLAGFMRQDYVYAVHVPAPRPTAQPIDRMFGHHPETQPWDWWLLP